MLELPAITQIAIWIKVAAVICGLLALPLLIGTRQKRTPDKNDIAAIALIALGFFLHGSIETILRLSPHDTFSGYVLGGIGDRGEQISALSLSDLGFPPNDISSFPWAPHQELFVTRSRRNLVPASFWDSNGKLFTRCEYRRWDRQITQIDARPIPGASELTPWHWTSHAEGRFWFLLETLSALFVLSVCIVWFRALSKEIVERTEVPAQAFPNTWAIRIYLAVLVLLIAWVIFVRASDRIFQYRADVLLRNIQRLELRKSTWEEAQSLQREYVSNAQVKEPCTEVHCDLNIELDHWYPLTLPEKFPLLILRAMDLVGGRWAQARATVHVRDGVVWGKSFHVVVPHRKGYALIADTTTVRSFSSRNHFLDSPAGNVAYGRPGGCEICDALWAQVTPFASASEMRDAFAFDLSCIGGTLRACTSAGSLLPVAARHVYHVQDIASSANWRIEPPAWAIEPLPLTADMLRQIGRDACRIGIIEFISSRPENPNKPRDPVEIITFKVLEALKDNAVRGDKQSYDCRNGAEIREQREARFVPNRFSVKTPPSDKQFIGFWIGDRDMRLLIPVSDESLILVKQGIAEDSIDIP